MELPVVQCPAGEGLEGPPGEGPAVVCRVMRRERERTDQILHGASGGIVVSAKKNAHALFGFCCGRGLPVVDTPPEEGRGHHTNCPVWRAEVERIAEGREMVAEPKRRGSIYPFGKAPPRDFSTPPDEAMDPERILQAALEMAPRKRRG